MNLASGLQSGRPSYCLALVPPGLFVSFAGDRRVKTISINQVLSNQNLINFNKFAQVQRPWGCGGHVGVDRTGVRARADLWDSQFTKGQSG